ncbi:MAG: L,D-transpeptidase family protein [Azoarcus sp.]|nr:L,D-transpeptidase family protein [Azoarcus sp.]
MAATQDFLAQQKQYVRVRDALREKGDVVARVLAARGLKPDALNVIFVAYKGDTLEVHAKHPSSARYEKLAQYPVCAASGAPGPKRRQGDRQVPEGFYHIDRFNPASHYHLSLGVSYPNAADRIRSRAADLGGDIFIHGKCVTIGCLPMTDDKIKEIYLYAVYARASGQKEIPVYIFPFRMTPENMARHGNHEAFAFWTNLKTGYDLFTANGEALTVRVASNGDYSFGR